MINKSHLTAIRTSFSVDHLYTNAVPTHSKLELTPYDGAVVTLIGLVHQTCDEPKSQKATWLLNVVFNFGKSVHFVTPKDAHVHVMVSLDTLVNVVSA